MVCAEIGKLHLWSHIRSEASCSAPRIMLPQDCEVKFMNTKTDESMGCEGYVTYSLHELYHKEVRAGAVTPPTRVTIPMDIPKWGGPVRHFDLFHRSQTVYYGFAKTMYTFLYLITSSLSPQVLLILQYRLLAWTNFDFTSESSC